MFWMVGLFKEKSLQHFSCFSIFSNGDLVRTTFFKCPCDSEIYGWVLHMSSYPMIVSDPKCITYPSRTKQSNYRENQIFALLTSSIPFLRKSRSEVENAKNFNFAKKKALHYFLIFAKGDFVRSTFCKCPCDSKCL